MVSCSLSEYVAQVTSLVERDSSPQDIVAELMPWKEKLLRNKNLIPESFLEEREGADYSRNLLYADPEGRFVVMALVWRAGAETLPHDHQTWGVVGIYKNAMSVVNFAEPKSSGAALEICGEATLDAGGVVGVKPPRLRNLHIMKNETPEPSITIHTYGDSAKKCRTYCPETGDCSDIDLAFHASLP